MKNATKVVAYQLINYSGHSGKKTIQGAKNRKSAMKTGKKNISKGMPISLIVGPNKPKKAGRNPGTKNVPFLLHT